MSSGEPTTTTLGAGVHLARADSGNVTDIAISSLQIETGGQNRVSKDKITDELVRQQAYRWCRDSIGGTWLKVASQDELIIKPISTGMSNYLFIVSLPTNLQASPHEPSTVLLRIYGQISKSTLDFLVHNSVVFALLAERNLGPKPYGLYHDGRIEEFLDALPVSTEDLQDKEVMRLVAGEMAQFHALDMPLCKKPRWFKSLTKGWIREIRNNPELNSDTFEKLQEMSPGFDIDVEFQKLLYSANSLDCPVVFCHNDLQCGNVLLADKDSTTTPRITIIDFEYSHYNYRGYDIANHFNEWMYDYSSEGKPGFKYIPEYYPSKAQQFSFIRSYLMSQGRPEVTSQDLVSLYREVVTLSGHSHFLWGVWSMFQALTSTIDFDYKVYALARFQAYLTYREKLSSLLADCWGCQDEYLEKIIVEITKKKINK